MNVFFVVLGLLFLGIVILVTRAHDVSKKVNATKKNSPDETLAKAKPAVAAEDRGKSADAPGQEKKATEEHGKSAEAPGQEKKA